MFDPGRKSAYVICNDIPLQVNDMWGSHGSMTCGVPMVNDMWGSHGSMTCGVNGIYLTFGSFNGIDLIIPCYNENLQGVSI
jgi:hypothetical protein